MDTIDFACSLITFRIDTLKKPSITVTHTPANDTLVAHTEFENARYHSVIEYPIKTMNANERDSVYQTDVGEGVKVFHYNQRLLWERVQNQVVW